MIQPGHGTVLYNRDYLHLACVARSESVNYKICVHNGTVINSGTLHMGAEVIAGNFIHFREVDISLFAPDTDYYVTYWYEDSVLKEQVVIFNAFIYRPHLDRQYNDYPFLGSWATPTDLVNLQTSINSNTDTRTTEIKEKIETTYLGNKKVEMSYCTEVPDPNPRNLFVGCADYITETIKEGPASDWTTPVSTKITYYWYDANQKQIKVGEQG